MYEPYYTTVSGVKNFLGNIHMPADAQIIEHIENSENEVNAKLASLYEVPIDLDTISDENAGLLDTICAEWAAGYLICASALATEDNQVDAYGKMLIDDAKTKLGQILDGEILLIGAEDADDYVAPNSAGPKIRVDRRRFDANGTEFGGKLNVYRDRKSYFGDDDAD